MGQRIKGSVRYSVWTPEFEKKHKGYIGRNVMSIAIQIRSKDRIF